MQAKAIKIDIYTYKNKRKHVCPLCGGWKFSLIRYASSEDRRSSSHATPQLISWNLYSYLLSCNNCGIVITKRKLAEG